MRRSLRVGRWSIWAVLLIALIAVWPVVAEPGLLNTRGGGDSPFLLQRLHQLETAVRDGHFPVRWMPDANYGYGYPFFNYYAPLSIYIAALFRFWGFSYVRAIHLAQVLGFVVAAWGMFHLGWRWLGSRLAGLLTAVAYTVAPFHMVNVYVRGDSLAEFWAMALYPVVLLTADDLVRADKDDDRWRRMALFAVSYAAIILSHNISALIFSPFLLLYLLLAMMKRRSNLVFWPLAFLLALGLAAWFFVPALAEQSLAQLEPVTAGYFHFSNHFRGSDLVQGQFFFDYNPDGGIAFRMGLVQTVTAVIGLLLLWRYSQDAKNERQFIGWFIFLTGIIATFMITPWSQILWEQLPLLSFTQFPWRFLSIQALATALATGSLARLGNRSMAIGVVAGATAVLFWSALGHLSTDHLILSDADVTAEKLAQYEWFTGNIGSTVSAEYLPTTVQPRPYTSRWLIDGERFQGQVLAGRETAVSLVSWASTQQQWQIHAGPQGAIVQLPTIYWPGWRAMLDEEEIAIRPSPGSGLMMLDVPPGEHIVHLWLARTPIRLGAELVSLVAMLLAGWLLRSLWPLRFWGYGLAVILFVASGLRLWPETSYRGRDLTWDFAQMGYLHHDIAGVAFENGVHLQGYTLSTDVVSPGEQVTIALDWQERPPTQLHVALASPAVNRFEAVPLLVCDAEGQQATCFVPENAPRGLYVPRLTLADGRPLLPSGRVRGALFLRPIRVIATPETAVLPDDMFEVELIDGTVAEDHLQLQLAWFTAQPQTLNYNVSLRLLTAEGYEVVQQDGQPGYGFQPSGSWLAATWHNDWLALALPNTLSESALYRVVMRLYEVETGEVVLTRRLGELVPQGEGWVFQHNLPEFVLPESRELLTAVLGDVIGLHGYTLAQTSTALDLTLYWQALGAPPTDFTRFVHLVRVEDGSLVTQNDGWTQNNSYPTSQWVRGEIVADAIRLDLTTISPGEYRLLVGFYENLGDHWPRLTAVDDQQNHFANDAVPIPLIITR